MLLLEKGKLYDEDGLLAFDSRGEEEAIKSFIRSERVAVYVDSLSSYSCYGLLESLIFDEKARVIANKRGIATGSRILSRGKETRWIVSAPSWGRKHFEPGDIKDIRRTIDYVGVGWKPTSSSLGTAHMRHIWYLEHLKKHTCLPLWAELFIRKNAFGGIVQTPGRGMHYDELMMLDRTSAWIAEYVLHPCGSCFGFHGESNCWTYFAECEVFVPNTLPLGPFPVKSSKKSGTRTVWPTEEGYYHTYLWKEQVQDCREAGVFVRVIRGVGWNDYTTDNSYWAQEAYRLRKSSPDTAVAKYIKGMSVAGVGHHGQDRQFYYLSPDNREGRFNNLLNNDGEPLNYYLAEEEDNSVALMPHWFYYTVMMCNRTVYKKALHYAKEGRLVSIDFDSILVLDHDERHTYVSRKRYDMEDVSPGQWLWELLHNVDILGDRSFRSDEVSKLPGRSKSVSKEEESENKRTAKDHHYAKVGRSITSWPSN